MDPLVSVVTPVYNEAQHLGECIESVLAQTYQNWEYTIVDNRSGDSSLEIARRYAAKDARIRVVENQEFLPVVRNHNTALRSISRESKYCKIVFADDWIFPECLARLVAVAEAHPSVGIVSAYVLEGQRVVLTGLPYQGTFWGGRTICRMHILESVYVFGSANALLYRADLVRSHDPFYNESNIHSDTEACFALLRSCDFGFVHQVLTFNRVRAQSLSTTFSSGMQSDYACMLRVLKTYGHDYLTDEELKGCLDQHLSGYYRYLGKNVLLSREKEFWDYHKGKLIESGEGFSRARLAKGLLATLFDALLNPKNTVEKLMKRNPHSGEIPSQADWAEPMSSRADDVPQLGRKQA